jgi:hypothetical protein
MFLIILIDMEDEDYVMEEDEEEEEEMRINNSNSPDKSGSFKAVYPEGFVKHISSASPQFAYQGFTRYEMNSVSSPVFGWNEAIDEKGDSVALLMQLEKSIVHQKFFNGKT